MVVAVGLDVAEGPSVATCVAVCATVVRVGARIVGFGEG
jgi:hypothetical protein